MNVHYSISASSITQISKNFLHNDFKFQCGQSTFLTSKIIADFISPTISKIHLTDPTFDTFNIDSNPQICIRLLENLATCASFDASSSDIKEIIEILRQLGNTDLINQIFDKSTLSVDNIVFELNVMESRDAFESSLIDFAASHIGELDPFKFSSLSLGTISNILKSASLVIESEGKLLNLIKSLISMDRDKFSPLLSYIELDNLEKDDIEDFINLISLDDIDEDIWTKLKYRIIKSELRNKNSDNDLYVKQINVDQTNPFNGIMQYLIEEYNQDLSNPTIIQLRDINRADGDMKNLFDYTNFTSSSWWWLGNQVNNYGEIDFITRRVRLTHYSIHTVSNWDYNYNHPKTWSIEGSNDRDKWTVLDNRVDDECLHGGNIAHTFQCSNKTKVAFRYIRFVNRGYSHYSNPEFYVGISGLELFGSIIEMNN